MNTAMKETRNPAWPLIFLTHATAGLFFAYETAGALGPDLGRKERGKEKKKKRNQKEMKKKYRGTFSYPLFLPFTIFIPFYGANIPSTATEMGFTDHQIGLLYSGI
jgi:hypothetical protein